MFSVSFKGETIHMAARLGLELGLSVQYGCYANSLYHLLSVLCDFHPNLPSIGLRHLASNSKPVILVKWL